ncbi:putative ubiquitin carboxyl-terminal hydrolase [Hypoxylon trugodes]|uniref:putative ubiquitin carboxyl-terminal hydrolase n=1 Tax=Hypoxylon trugodes TaxID=326681 RepID=UPI00219FAB53|nr:putative ubiquitin carboxyl-terminal hydrolase [Hypoxylon trugodes]KAI1383165.1 putative ubiquitin carboxyl-terminal hydrolase [Hypoxylon trugodes]
MEKKTWVVLENNPEVMNQLAARLGLSSELSFYDVWSLDEPELIAHIPRPAFALLVILPLTPAWKENRQAEDVEKDDYDGYGPEEPVIWFRQTIGNACGSIGLLHCAINGPAAEHIQPGSDLEKIRRDAIPLKMTERADLLYNSVPFEEAHKSCVHLGDTAPRNEGALGQHFVAFVKANGRLWELEGSRKGPIDRGSLKDDEDVLSSKALDLGIGRVIRLDQEAGGADLRFSCIALSRKA